MGVVFLATDTTLDRRVAIKVVHPELAAHDSITTPFTNLETLYGDDAPDGVLPSHGPAFHIWRIG